MQLSNFFGLLAAALFVLMFGFGMLYILSLYHLYNALGTEAPDILDSVRSNSLPLESPIQPAFRAFRKINVSKRVFEQEKLSAKAVKECRWTLAAAASCLFLFCLTMALSKALTM